MFSAIFLLQGQIPVPTGNFDIYSITNSPGWQVGLFIGLVVTILTVIRQRSQISLNTSTAEVAQQARDSDFRTLIEKSRNELQNRHDKLMDEIRLQMFQERNEAQSRLMNVMDGQQSLSTKVIESQQTTIKMQDELNTARKAEEKAVEKSNELQKTVEKLTGDVTVLKSQLATANNRIDEMMRENAKLKLAVQRIKTGTTDKIIPPPEVIPP